MSDTLTTQVLEFVSRQFSIGIEEIDMTTSLVDQGVIDSFGVVEIVSFMEKTCSVKISDDMITVENFGSIEKMVAFVETLPKV